VLPSHPVNGGRKLAHNADKLISAIVAKRLVERLDRAGVIGLKRTAIVGCRAFGRPPRLKRGMQVEWTASADAEARAHGELAPARA